MPLDGDRTMTPILQGDLFRGEAEIAPGGDWLAYISARQVHVQPYPGPGPTVPVSIEGGARGLVWAPDGSTLYYQLGDRMMTVDLGTDGETVQVGRPTELFRGDYVTGAQAAPRQFDVARDGRFLMKLRGDGETAGDAVRPQVVLVQHWFAELQRLEPTDR